MRVAQHWSLCRDDALDAYQRALEIYVRCATARAQGGMSGAVATFPPLANVIRNPPESKPPTEGRVERIAPWGFVAIGVAMIAVAAADLFGD